MLDQQIWTLACVEKTSSPVVSCYLNAGDLQAGLEERLKELRSSVPVQVHDDFEQALAQIESFRRGQVFSARSSLAIFARSGTGFRSGPP